MIDWEHFYRRLRAPDFLPGYEIQNRLGGGAFGDVYKARKHSIGKVYAVKFLKVSEGPIAERELGQVSLFAAIDHPNLVTVEDVGVVMGVPYVIMGYAGEDTLARRLLRRELDRDTMLRIFVQVCRGVLALHDRRLAHFDLKPSNIFLRGDAARVGDYGLSKLISDGKQTLSFGRGTPHYMAPEMLRNRADHRADIYSLGIILFEVLTGELPFDMAEGVVVREEDLPPDFPDDFPVALRSVVERATRLNPDDRYSSVLGLLEDMHQTANPGDPVQGGGSIPYSPHSSLEAGGQSEASGSREEGQTVGTPALSGDPSEEETPVPEELRRTAAELARGAVGVARGMWDGVRARSSEALGRPASVRSDQDQGERSERDGSEADLGEDVVSFQTLDDPDEDEPSSESSSSTRRTPILGVLARERTRRAGSTEPAVKSGDSNAGRSSGSQTFSPWNALPAVSAASVGRTVPVPPAAEGGWIGSMIATLVLGFEVMVAILSGPVFYVMRGVGRGVDRAFRPIPGFFGSSLKLVLFLVLLAMLGGLLTLIWMLVWIG